MGLKASGDYWIDPNGNDHRDSILVFCDMSTGATCINPKPSLSPILNIIFHCRNMVAFLNLRNQPRNAVSFMAWNDLEIRHRGKSKYKVLKDDCKFKKNSWAQTTFNIETAKPARLPITDIKLEDFGEQNQEFKLELGQVCFS